MRGVMIYSIFYHFFNIIIQIVNELGRDKGYRELFLPDFQVPGGGGVWEGVWGHWEVKQRESSDKEDWSGDLY